MSYITNLQRLLAIRENRRLMFKKYSIAFVGGVVLGLSIIYGLVWYMDLKSNLTFFIGLCLGNVFTWLILRYLDIKWKYKGIR